MINEVFANYLYQQRKIINESIDFVNDKIDYCHDKERRHDLDCIRGIIERVNDVNRKMTNYNENND